MAEWPDRWSRNLASQVRVPLWSLAETELVPVLVQEPCREPKNGKLVPLGVAKAIIYQIKAYHK